MGHTAQTTTTQTMASALRLVGISGSLRASSFNTGILRYAAANAPENVELEIANIDFPLYNGDVEAASGLPDGVTALADQIRAADGVVLAVPEYNYSIAAPLKNAIDWLSRARDESGKTPFDSKKITLVSAAGRMGVACAIPSSPGVCLFEGRRGQRRA